MVWAMLLSLGLIMMLGLPIALALIIVSSIFILIHNPNMNLLISGAARIYEGLLSYPLLAIPFFIFVGLVMNEGGMSERLFRFAKNMVGHLQGGLGHVNVVASMIFAGMTGSAVAEAAGLGVVQIKAMKDEGYSAEFAGALTAASSTIGPVIPPSIPFVIYAWLTGTSVAKLFLAGVIPGVTMGLSLMLMVAIISKKRNYPRHPLPSRREVFGNLKDAAFAIICPVLIIGGILTGVFTPTEAGAAASLYAFVIVAFVYRSLTLKGLIKALSDTVYLTSKIMFVIAAAGFFSWTTNYLHISDQLLGDLLYLSEKPYIVSSMIVIILLILGCFLDGTAIMMITIPMFLPVLNKVGIDLIHFGVVFTLSIMIGLLTPPFGLSLFTVSTITGLSVGQTAKSVVPFMMMLFIPLILAIFWPTFSLFIPNLLMGAD